MPKKITSKDASEIVNSIFNPPKEVIESYKKMLYKLNKGLPLAGGEVMNSRIRW